MLEKMYNLAKKNNSDLVICDYYEITENNKVVKKAIKHMSEDIKINYMLSNTSPWNKLIKADIFKANNIKFMEGYIYEDLATMPILAEYAKNIIYLEEPLYNYIIRNGSTMRQKKYNKKLESIFVAIEYLEKEFKERKLDLKYKEEIEYIYIEHLLYAASRSFFEI
jgi:hypothetical protein